MSDGKKDKKQYKYLSIKHIRSGVIPPNNNANVSFVFEVEAENIAHTNATIKVFEHSQFGLLLEKGKTVTNINKKGKTSVMVTLKKNVLSVNPSTDYSATIECDGAHTSTMKFKIGNGNTERQKNNSCFCNRDFTPTELQNIVIELRKKLFIIKKVYTLIILIIYFIEILKRKKTIRLKSFLLKIGHLKS